jgi:hypothetical protein
MEITFAILFLVLEFFPGRQQNNSKRSLLSIRLV